RPPSRRYQTIVEAFPLRSLRARCEDLGAPRIASGRPARSRKRRAARRGALREGRRARSESRSTRCCRLRSPLATSFSARIEVAAPRISAERVPDALLAAELD